MHWATGCALTKQLRRTFCTGQPDVHSRNNFGKRKCECGGCARARDRSRRAHTHETTRCIGTSLHPLTDGHCCRTVCRKQASSHDPTDAARTFRVGLTGTGRSKKSGHLSTLVCVQPKHHTVNVCDVRGRPLVILICLLMAPAGCCSVITCCLCVYGHMSECVHV